MPARSRSTVMATEISTASSAARPAGNAMTPANVQTEVMSIWWLSAIRIRIRSMRGEICWKAANRAASTPNRISSERFTVSLSTAATVHTTAPSSARIRYRARSLGSDHSSQERGANLRLSRLRRRRHCHPAVLQTFAVLRAFTVTAYVAVCHRRLVRYHRRRGDRERPTYVRSVTTAPHSSRKTARLATASPARLP